MSECGLSSFDESLTKVADSESGSVGVTDLEVNDRISAEILRQNTSNKKEGRTFRH